MELGDLFRVARNRRRLLRHDRMGRRDLLEMQSQALAALRADTYLRSTFYRRFHDGVMGHALEDLPVLTKTDLMRHFDELSTDPALTLQRVERHVAVARETDRLDRRYVVSASSGSTGQRGFSVFDRDEWAMVLASYGRAAWWAGMQPAFAQLFDPVRCAMYTSPVAWHQTAQVRAFAKTRIMPALQLDATRPASDVTRDLDRWMPEYLATYASLARALAEEQLAGRLHITPRYVGVGGEVLTRQNREVIERAWGPVLYDTYGASETGILAAECTEHRGLHLCEDLNVIEVVDATGREVEPGEYGERVLVTSLFRRTQPLIRYEIGDRVRLSPHTCPCGRPFRLIDGIQGRIEETLRFPALTGGEVAIDPIVFESVLDTVRARQWQVVQEADSVDVLLVGLAAGEDTDAMARRLAHELSSRGADAPAVRVLRVDAIPRGATGKAPLIRKASSRHGAAAFLDLARHPQEMKRILVSLGLAGKDEAVQATPLTGGVSSGIYRVDLASGRYCVKQALPKLKVAKDWEVPVERVFSEVAYLRAAGAIVPGHVPWVLGEDTATKSFVMPFLGPEYRNWKAELLAGRIDPAVAASMGNVLGRIHSATADDAGIASRFATDDNFLAIRLEPYLIEAGRVHRELQHRLFALVERTASSKRALVHGDVSPKNILVGPDGPVLLDAECAWYGDPAFDVAFCLNHFLLKSAHRPQFVDAWRECQARFIDAYAKQVHWESWRQLEGRIATLLPALALARVDGKSPVEYLAERVRDDVRAAAVALIESPSESLEEVSAHWMGEFVQ